MMNVKMVLGVMLLPDYVENATTLVELVLEEELALVPVVLETDS